MGKERLLYLSVATHIYLRINCCIEVPAIVFRGWPPVLAQVGLPARLHGSNFCLFDEPDWILTIRDSASFGLARQDGVDSF